MMDATLPAMPPLADHHETPSPAPPAGESPTTSAEPGPAPASHQQPQLKALVDRTQAFADQLSSEAAQSPDDTPQAHLARLGALGLLTAPLLPEHGGLGLGLTPGTHLPLLRILAAIGGGDLVLGRLFEGHVNALILINSFGSPAQQAQAADDARAGKVFGVWNTGARDLLQLEGGPAQYTLRGVKTFASGAAFVERPIVTAQDAAGGWQMTLPRMETPEVATAIQLDRAFWQPLGMEDSGSFGIDFTGAVLCPDDLIGAPGDFYADPLFRGGAVRFAAVQAGAVLRLHVLFTEWLVRGQRGEDPYQLARLGEVGLLAQAAALWIEMAAVRSEEGLFRGADKLSAERAVSAANTTRLAIERIATATMQHVIAGVGAHGLLHRERFQAILRNLTMYLRQPAPDQTLADTGRATLRIAGLGPVTAVSDHLWHREPPSRSLGPVYFDRLYAGSPDPWNFEASDYEANKYRETLAALPRPRYASALEVGCSIGVLTEKLASRCDALLSLDVSAAALDRARSRCAHLPQVRFERMQVPRELPTGSYDLIVISEVAYYWERSDLYAAAASLAALQSPGAHLLLVHFTGPVPDYPLTGDQVHDFWLRMPEWQPLEQQRHDGYRLALLERR